MPQSQLGKSDGSMALSYKLLTAASKFLGSSNSVVIMPFLALLQRRASLRSFSLLFCGEFDMFGTH